MASDEVSNTTDIRITLRDVYAIQLEQTKTLATMSTTLQALTDKIDGSKEVQIDHESRLRKLEAKIYSLPSLATILAAGSLVVAWKK